MSNTLWTISFVLIIGLHVSALIVAIMSMLMVHRYDRSDLFKNVLLAFSGITVLFATVGGIFVFTGLSLGWFGNTKKRF